MCVCVLGEGPYPLKTIFPLKFIQKNYTIDRGHQTLLISEEKKFYRFKLVAIWKFSLRIIAQYPKIWRTTFTKDFFDKIWLTLADYQ